MGAVFHDGFLKRSTDVLMVAVAVESVGGVVVGRVGAVARMKGLEFLRGCLVQVATNADDVEAVGGIGGICALFEAVEKRLPKVEVDREAGGTVGVVEGIAQLRRGRNVWA